MDRGAWQTTVHGLAKSQTRLSNQHQAYLMWGISCYSFLCLLLRVFREVTCSHLCPEKMTSFPLVWLRAENMKFSGGLIMITSSMEFSRQEYWGRLPFPSSGDLPNPGIEPAPVAFGGRFFTTSARRNVNQL